MSAGLARTLTWGTARKNTAASCRVRPRRRAELAKTEAGVDKADDELETICSRRR